jgi:ubiquinone/menaquinone biosynthesis C-methylase UbiE/ribosomal protein S18 acetylase RimI-like enzyme
MHHDASEQDLRSYYAQRAAEYDRVYAKPERQADLRRIEQWLVAALRDETVLEVACGTGWWTRWIAPVARAVLAIDAAAETLAIARARVDAPHVAFELGDAYALPRGRAAFGAAFAGFWFSHVPRARQAEFLRGLNASLQPGAKVVLLDNRYVEGSSTPIAERDAAGDTWQARRLDDGSTHRVLKNFPTEAELRALAASGLGTAPVHRVWDHYWAFEYRVPEPEPELALAGEDEIRAGTSDDLAALVDCDPLAARSEARRDALAAWLAQATVLVSREQERVAGFLVLEHGLFGHGFVPLVCVRPDARRRGHALRLLGAAEAHCRTAKLFASANASNVAAQAMFARAGFARSGTIENLDAGDPELVYFKAVSRDDGD